MQESIPTPHTPEEDENEEQTLKLSEETTRRDFLKRVGKYAVGGAAAANLYRDYEPSFHSAKEVLFPKNEEDWAREREDNDTRYESYRQTIKKEVMGLRQEYGESKAEEVMRSRLRNGIEKYLAYNETTQKEYTKGEPSVFSRVGAQAGINLPYFFNLVDRHHNLRNITDEEINGLLFRAGLGDYAIKKVHDYLASLKERNEPLPDKEALVQLIETTAYASLLEVVEDQYQKQPDAPLDSIYNSPPEGKPLV